MSYEDLLNDAAAFPSFENAEPFLRRKYGNAMLQQARMKLDTPPTPKNMRVSEQYMGNAQFTIQIKRMTNLLNFSLPVPIFGTVERYERWASALAGLLPVGVTIANFASSGKTFVITFTDGISNDTIEITCSTIGYEAMLAALTTDTMKIKKIRYTISDVTKQEQFSQQITFYQKSLFGKNTGDNLTPDSYKVPSQNQNNLIDIDTTFTVDKDTTMVVNIADTNVAGFSVSLNCFVSDYLKLNASNLR